MTETSDMEFKNVTSPETMQDLLSFSMNWGHAFIREGYAISPSYQLPNGKGTVNPDVPVDLFILIMTDYEECPAVEFLFRQVEQIEISCTSDVELQGVVIKDRFGHKYISFSFGSGRWIKAKKMEYRLLGNEILGNRRRYGQAVDHDFNY